MSETRIGQVVRVGAFAVFAGWILTLPGVAAVQMRGFRPAPLCEVASDHDVSWFPINVPIRWGEYSDKPGTYGCYGHAYDRTGVDTTLRITFDLLGNVDFAKYLTITARNDASHWFEPRRKLLPLVRDLFRATGLDLPSNLQSCIASKCSGTVQTTTGPVFLGLSTGPTRGSDGIHRDWLEYKIHIDFVPPADSSRSSPVAPKPPAPPDLERRATEDCIKGGTDYDAVIQNCLVAIVGMMYTADEGPKIWSARGHARRMKGYYDDAIKDFDKALSTDPRNAATLNERGLAYAGKENYAEAFKNYDAAVRIDSGNAVFLSNRGVASLRLENYDRAGQDFERALRIQPTHVAAMNGRGLVRRQRGQYAQAIEDFTLVMSLAPTSATYVSNRGVARLLAGQLDLALADFNASLKLNPKYAFALFGRGVIKRRTGDAAGADADLAAAMAAQPDVAAQMAKRGVTAPSRVGSRPAASEPPTAALTAEKLKLSHRRT